MRVLFLDRNSDWIFGLCDKNGLLVEIVEVGNYNPPWGFGEYVIPQGCLEMTAKLTETGEVSFVVIGNNLGIGMVEAEMVSLNMRPHTIIVWNNYCLGDEQPYAAMGFEHFCSRMSLKTEIEQLIAAN